MSKAKRLNYHSLFDPGSAAIQFPLKGRYLAHELTDDFDEQLRRVIQFQLLWRPSLVVRHIDLFNNIPLMRFMRSNEAERLRLQGMLDVIVPDDSPFTALFAEWAFGNESQHFHHLDPVEQHLYNDLCGGSSRPSVASAKDHLQFERFGLDLERSLVGYERLFRGHREILKWSPLSENYPRRVLASWDELLQDRSLSNLHSASDLNQVDALIRNGAANGWRRKAFFTAIESLEFGTDKKRRQTKAGHTDSSQPVASQLIRDVKLIVLNSPFYEELQALRYEESNLSAPIWVTRDLTAMSRPTSRSQDEKPPELSPSLSVDVQPFYKVPLRHVIRWHSPEEKNEDFSAFRESVFKIDSVLNEVEGPLPAKQLHSIIVNHVEVLNACVRRSNREHLLGIDQETTILQAFAPRMGPAVLAGAASALSLLASVTAVSQGWTGLGNAMGSWAIGTLVSSAATITLTSPRFQVKTQPWDRAEGILKQEIETQVISSNGVIPSALGFGL